MKRIRFIVSMLLAVLMLASFGLASAGAATGEKYNFLDNCDFMQNIQYVPADDVLKVFCANMKNMPSASAFTVHMDGEKVEVLSLDSAEKEPVTYLCLVDISGSIEKWQLDSAKEMLRALVDSMDEDDQMMIATLSDELKMSTYISSKATLKSRIDDIRKTENDTNLYRGIVDTLDELITNTDVTPRKALVVFSDGIDDIAAEQNASIWTAARDKVQSTRIPVYTMLPSVDNYYREYQKSLSSLSVDYSVGGESYYLASNEFTAEQVGRKITADMKGDKVLRLDLTGYRPTEEEFILAAEFTNLAGKQMGDTLRIISTVLGTGTITPAPTKKPMPIVTGSDTIIETGPDWQMWLKIGIGALCILLAALVVWLILKKRKDEQKRADALKEDRIRREQQELQNRKSSGSDDYGNRTAPVGPADGWNVGGTRDLQRPSGGKPVRFTAIGNQSFSVDMSLQEGRQTSVGRTKKSDYILNKDDTKLSGMHFALMMKNGKLFIRDEGSTNGTAVNGVPLKGSAIELHNGDTVSVGSYQYRVRF